MAETAPKASVAAVAVQQAEQLLAQEHAEKVNIVKGWLQNQIPLDANNPVSFPSTSRIEVGHTEAGSKHTFTVSINYQSIKGKNIEKCVGNTVEEIQEVLQGNNIKVTGSQKNGKATITVVGKLGDIRGRITENIDLSNQLYR